MSGTWGGNMPRYTHDKFEDADAGPPDRSVPGQLPHIRRSPTGRVPQWSLEEAFRLQPEANPVSLPPARPKAAGSTMKRRARWNRRRARPRLRAVRNTALAIGVLLFLYHGTAFIDRQVAPIVGLYLPWSDVPPRGVEADANPLGTPPAAPASKAYQLPYAPNSSQPFAAYDPCRPIHYVIRPDGAPAGSEALIHEAVAEVSAATGLRFVYDGPTNEAPSHPRETYQPDAYGKRWAPVLIAWSSPAGNPELAGNVAGLGGSTMVNATGSPFVLVAGKIELDAPDLAATLAAPSGAEHVQAVVMHELGHVLGLGHVDDPAQLMYGGPNSVTELQDGDRAGLAVLGTGACVPQL